MRPHKVFDYMFIQMSNEQFQREYQGQKIKLFSTEKNEARDSQNQQYTGNSNLIYQNQFIEKDKQRLGYSMKSPEKLSNGMKTL